ncbi:MAG: AAA family ATPase [Dolichospermum sp.]
MIRLTGYKIVEKIYCSSETSVFRAIREKDSIPVVIKFLRQEYPKFEKLVQLRNEYTIIKNLNITGIIKTYSLENYKNGYALVMEDFPGISLQEKMKEWGERGMGNSALGLKEFFNIALQIVSILAELHHQRVIHKDIKTANILVQPHTLEVKLIDFSIACLLKRETQTLASPNVLEGTLSYLSPEQTGRINRLVDYRTDFYSLGVTFFELLTGKLPFASNDPIELIHYHIAKKPPLLHNIHHHISPILSAIIHKLMAKNAEYRYQSAHGIKYDLEMCIKAGEETGNIQTFELGKRDISDRLIIPEKLYGREVEVKTLLTAFEHICADNKEMILVVGHSGIGKTAVVNEVHKPIVCARGYFIKGKFDQFQRNIPFFAFIQAFRNLIDQLLTESDDQLQEWKTKILSALGENAQVIIAVIPELEQIIGKQPQLPELSTMATENRFNLLFEKFIHVFTTQKHPLVIFLDDLQWVDLASLKLIQLLMTTNEISYLLLIGAYRDNEVSATDPLILTIENLRKTASIINTITLNSLNQSDLNQLIADTLNCPTTVALPFTELVYLKTQGNPFFSHQFIKSLYEDGLIRFNFDCRYWQCDIAQIQALAITNDVVEFMALQLQKLPESTQSVLKLAACIGNQFNLDTLAKINEKSQIETAVDLWKALLEEFIIPTTKIYNFFQSDLLNNQQLSAVHNYEEQKFSYRFLHDRVQQAAYSLIPEQEKQSTHLKVGQLLLKNSSEKDIEENIFEIVNQLNMGINLITVQSEKYAVAQLNLMAGSKAKSATAYDAAFRYLKKGLSLLAADSWQHEYNLTLNLYIEAVEAAYLNIYPEQAITYIEIVNKNAISVLDEVKVYKKQMLMQDMELTFNRGLKLLEKLEVTIEEVPVTNVKVEDLIHLPKMTDPYKLAAMGILMGLGFIAYFSQLEMELPIILTIINLAIKYGNCVESAYTYICYSLIVCDRFSDIDTGYNYGKLALNLSEQFDNQVIRFRILMLWYSNIIYWKQHFRGSIVPLQEIAEYGWKIGETDFLGFAYTFNMFMMLFAGENLTTVSEYLENSVALISHRKLEWHSQNIKTWQQIIFNLQAINQDKCQFNGDFFTEELFLFLVNHKNYHSLFGFYLTKTMQFYLFKEYQKALDSAIIAKQYITSVPGQITVSQHNFYYSLSLLAAYNYQSEHEQIESMKQVLANQEKMQYWAVNAPMNYQHKYDLIEAEKARVLGQMLLAMEYYDRAIQGANNYEYLHEEALSYELAAEFYLSLGRNEIASLYMTKAYYGYLRWGGKAKVDHLEKSYPQLLTKTLQEAKKPISMIISKNNNISEAIDLNTVIKFSQVIASEIHIDKLLSTLMEVIMENSSATKSVLILVKNNHLFVEAIKIDNATVIQKSTPVNLSKDIPINVINYVYNTAKIFGTDDIKTNLLIAADSYIVCQQPKSLLCLPIIHKSKFMGILYLENQLTLGAFTYNQIEVLNLLITQTAISLENAQLYSNLSEQADNLQRANQQLEEYAMTLKITNRLQKLADLSLAINSTLSTNNILQLVTQQAAKIIGAHQSIISIKIDESCTKAVHTVHLADKYEQWRENYEKFDESDFYKLGCQIQNSIRMTQTELEAHPAAINNNLPLRGWLVAPLIDMKGKHIGFMHLSDKYEGDFTEDDQAILVQLAQMVLLAMNNAHLYEESQRANRIKDEFLAVLSHELRSPLTSIIGWSQMLQSGKLSPEKTTLALETIERNAKSQTQLIEDVVDISRMVQGNISLNIHPVNLVTPIETAINTMYLAAKAKSIKILLTIASDHVIVLGDPIRLQQIVWNLLANAIKFTSPGGQVEIELKTIGSEAQIKVIDTGAGISPDFMPYIFDYFRQADASNTRNYGGLGIGLAIVRHLVELHGGNIWAESLGKEQGATFTVKIPLLQSQLELNPPKDLLNNPPNLTLDGVKVLVVDDNVDIREFLVFALEDYGAVVMTADSAREALKCLQQFPADILITDIGMPEENGYNLLNQIKSLESTQKRKIPAIALTGYTANEVINQVLKAGFQKYLPKPIDVFELITAICELI